MTFTANGGTLVGAVAKRMAATSPEHTIRSVKRHLECGRTCEVAGRAIPAVDIASLVFEKLKRDAEAYLGESIDDVVVAIPASTFQSRRDAIAAAACRAGLNVERILYEPTAAALAYSFSHQHAEQSVLVLDLGGGTLDVSVVELDANAIEVKTTCGDDALGGDDWDQRIVDYVLERIYDRHGIRVAREPVTMQYLKDAAERAKIALSAAESTAIGLRPILAANGRESWEASIFNLKRKRFQEITRDLLDKCAAVVRRAIDESRVRVSDLDHVVLVGGAARMPAVGNMVSALTGKAPSRGVNPDEAVAMGAAIQGGILKAATSRPVLLDVIPHTLRVRTASGIAHELIVRNTAIPTSRSTVFTTSDHDQDSLQVDIFQGEHDLVADNRLLGTFKITSIPPAPRGLPEIEVTVHIDASGATHVTARDLRAAQHLFVERT